MSSLIVALIPAFNEESHIASVLVRAKKHVDLVILCDDGSSDLTGDIAAAMGAVVIRNERNMGYGVAIRTLFKAALEQGADVAVTLDADDQHNPGEIPGLVEVLRSGGYDIVIGSRLMKGDGADVPGYRRRGIEIINRLSMNDAVSDSQSGFRAYSRRALESLNVTEDGMGVSTEILMKAEEAGLSIGEVPISVQYHEDSSTHNPVAHGVSVVLSIIKHLSIRHPLFFFGVPGFTVLIFSFLMWGYTLRIYSTSGFFSTNLAVVSLAATLIGLTLVTTSLIIWVMISVIKERG
jgi:glycosyltransferase involved in cell wall biosynthesis